MPSRFQRTYPPAQPTDGLAYWFPFQGSRPLVKTNGDGFALLQGDESLFAGLAPRAIIHFGTLDGISCMACEIDPEQTLPSDWHILDLRALFGHIDDSAYAVTGYASQLLLWQRNNHFCPSCGQKTVPQPKTWGRICTSCNYISYPPVTPAVLALVYDGDNVLLTHQPGWNKRYSVIAGFVEPGETLEECVQREVFEEANVEVTDVAYMGSQPWPFPHQMMLAFTARYVGGELRPDLEELDDARWYRYDALPELPAPLSLSYRLISQWAALRHREHGEQQNI